MGYTPYKPYSVVKTLWKVVKATGILGAGAVSAITLPDDTAGPGQWLLFIASLTPPLVEGVRNYRKNN